MRRWRGVAGRQQTARCVYDVYVTGGWRLCKGSAMLTYNITLLLPKESISSGGAGRLRSGVWSVSVSVDCQGLLIWTRGCCTDRDNEWEGIAADCACNANSTAVYSVVHRAWRTVIEEKTTQRERGTGPRAAVVSARRGVPLPPPSTRPPSPAHHPAPVASSAFECTRRAPAIGRVSRRSRASYLA